MPTLKGFSEMSDTYEDDPGAWLRQAIKNGSDCLNCNFLLSKVEKLNRKEQEKLMIIVLEYMINNYDKNERVKINSSEWRYFFQDLEGGRRRRRRRSRRKSKRKSTKKRRRKRRKNTKKKRRRRRK